MGVCRRLMVNPKPQTPYSPWGRMINKYTWMVSKYWNHEKHLQRLAKQGDFDGLSREQLKEQIAYIIKQDVECFLFSMPLKGNDTVAAFLAAATPGILEDIDFYALADLYLENTYAISSLNTQTIKHES